MNRGNSVFYNKMKLFLFQPYPFYYHGKNLWIIGGLLFVMTILFSYLFEPFVVYVPEHKMDYFWICVIHASIPFVIICCFFLYTKALHIGENWNVGREMFLISTFLLVIGIAQFFIRDFIYNNPNNWSWRYLYEEIRNTFLVGSLFAIFLTSLNYNRLNIKNTKRANALKLSDNAIEELKNSIVRIETQVKSDDFTLNLDDFLFAKSDGNYVEIYLNGDKIIKVIKRITLKELESTLKHYPNIFKTHRSFLVNLHHVKSVIGNAQGYKLEIINFDEKIPVARNMIQDFDALISNV